MSNIKVVLRYCSPEVEYLMIICRPHNLQRVLIYIFVAVYLLLQTDAGTKAALIELEKSMSKQGNARPEAPLLVAADFNAGKLKSVLPHFYQHVTFATRRKKPLDHLYSTHRDTFKALPPPPFGKSALMHVSVLLASKRA